MFAKDKGYKFSYSKFVADCNKDKMEVGAWAKRMNGCRVVPSADLKFGKWAGYLLNQEQDFFGRRIIRKEPMAYTFNAEWCEEV